MENTVVRHPEVTVAPYAATSIPLWLASLTGMRYRTLNCMECGAEFLERNNDSLFRLNDDSQPAQIMLNGSVVQARCGRCNQAYAVQVSLDVALEQDGIPLYLQPQSVYLSVDTVKKLRFLYCLECGKPFHTISDRIRQVTDNRVPFEFVDPAKIGPIQIMCHGQRCSQTWALML